MTGKFPQFNTSSGDPPWQFLDSILQMIVAEVVDLLFCGGAFLVCTSANATPRLPLFSASMITMAVYFSVLMRISTHCNGSTSRILSHECSITKY